jgi:ribosomal protein L40E
LAVSRSCGREKFERWIFSNLSLQTGGYPYGWRDLVGRLSRSQRKGCWPMETSANVQSSRFRVNRSGSELTISRGRAQEREKHSSFVAKTTIWRPRGAWVKPEETVLQTPMYRGRPARLWWLPEQETPKAPGDTAQKRVVDSVACGKCGEFNPADSVFCGRCRLFFEPPDSPAGPPVEQMTGRGQKAAGSRKNWQFGADRSVVKWRQGR